ncbi:MAG: hypothetical protein HC801_10465 [Nitrospira sp.]|nr:hypothetical protein [Nitrospira sp.]
MGHAQHWRPKGSKRQGFELDGERHAITCERHHGDGNCVACTVADWCIANGQSGLGKTLQAKAQYYLNLILVEENRQVVWGAPQSAVKLLADYVDSKHWGGWSIFDPKKGHNCEVERTGNPNTLSSIKYKVTIDPKASAIALDGWEDGATDLMGLIVHMPYEDSCRAMEENLSDVLPIKEILRKTIAKPATTKATKKKAGKKR